MRLSASSSGHMDDEQREAMERCASFVVCMVGNFSVLLENIVEESEVSTKKVTQYAGIVKASHYLNVRTGPGTSYSQYKVGGTAFRLPNGMVISIEEEDSAGKWGKLTNVDDAWVSLTYVTK